MIKIEIEPTDNGLIKKITDSNSNGAKQKNEYKTVHQLNPNNLKLSVDFIKELILDLNLPTGNISTSYIDVLIKNEYKNFDKMNLLLRKKELLNEIVEIEKLLEDIEC